jgi:hypothetical protein
VAFFKICRIANGQDVPLEGSVELKLQFCLDDGSNCEGWCWFEVLSGFREELILGVPDIFSKSTERGRDTSKPGLTFIKALNEDMGMCRDPWSSLVLQTEEEESIPDLQWS